MSIGVLGAFVAMAAWAAAPDFSQPLPGLTPAQLALFEAGRAAFETVEVPFPDGLGPIFNNDSCVSCHDVGGTGGGSDLLETRFGLRLPDGSFDPMEYAGGKSLRQLQAIPDYDGCHIPVEVVPDTANVTAQRRAIPLFGLGLVDAVPDPTFYALALFERILTPSTAGRVSVATDRTTGKPTVAKFGWKAAVTSLLEFSGDAYVNEMGITNALFPYENCPNGPLADAPGKCPILDSCNPVPGINDQENDIQKFTDFMSFLAPPPRGEVTKDVLRGEDVFQRIGCADCHLATLRTGPSSVGALSRKAFHPYSDFLLHEMGSLADGIGGNTFDSSGVEAIAKGSEMRTQPLWGLRVRTTLLHDGRATTIAGAIEAHDGQADRARDRFLRLPSKQREQLLAFLGSL